MKELVEGRVVRVDAKICHVEIDGEILQAAPRGSLFENLEGKKNPVAVGDFVKLDTQNQPAALVEVLPRTNALSRVASSHDPREQVLATNVDQLLVFSSVASPKFSSNRTDRILAACEWHRIPTRLVLNKIDLDKKGLLANFRATYDSVPVPVLETCATNGEGLDALIEVLRGKLTVLYGPSGAGKSTLLNTIQPGLQLKVGKISSHWEQGRHTTTFSRLIHLEMGGAVIDTPGIRVFRLHGIKKSQIRDLFPEFVRVQQNCKFPNCTHDHEPECAVLSALEDGQIAQSRYMSYMEMLVEAAPDDFSFDEEVETEDEEGELE
ncbi:MAG: ribosome small subunit-dependent GTPase A [bacterium]